MKPIPDADRVEILHVLQAYLAAMVGARTDRLESLLDSDFVLVHITDYRQPRAEWFAVIRSREFDYHAIDPVQLSLVVEATASGSIVRGRGIFNATISGMRNPWRLQFVLKLSKAEGEWKIGQAHYTSY